MKSNINNKEIYVQNIFNYSFDEKSDYWRITSDTGNNYSFNFENNHYKKYLKEFIYVALHSPNGNKVSTIYYKWLSIGKFLEWLEYNSITSFKKITSSEFYEYIDILESECKNTDIRKAIIGIYDFFTYFKSLISEYAYTEIEDAYKKYNVSLSRSMGFHLLPEEFFDSLLSLLIKERKNKNESYEYRAYCCLAVIQTQIGLRNSELIHLEHNSIIDKINFDIGCKFKYKIFKTAHKLDNYVEVESFLNPLALESWFYLHKICLEKFNSTSPLLFDVPKNEYKSLQDFLTKFCLKFNKYLLNINNIWYNNYMHSTHVKNICDEAKLPEFIEPDDTIAYPTVHQFRVYRIHKMVKAGIPLEIIAKTIGHKEDITTISYTRNIEEEYQELHNMKYGNYTKEMLYILTDLAKQEGVKLEDYINVPNGTCKNKDCERRKYVKNKYE